MIFSLTSVGKYIASIQLVPYSKLTLRSMMIQRRVSEMSTAVFYCRQTAALEIQSPPQSTGATRPALLSCRSAARFVFIWHFPRSRLTRSKLGIRRFRQPAYTDILQSFRRLDVFHLHVFQHCLDVLVLIRRVHLHQLNVRRGETHDHSAV